MTGDTKRYKVSASDSKSFEELKHECMVRTIPFMAMSARFMFVAVEFTETQRQQFVALGYRVVEDPMYDLDSEKLYSSEGRLDTQAESGKIDVQTYLAAKAQNEDQINIVKGLNAVCHQLADISDDLQPPLWRRLWEKFKRFFR